MVKYAAGAAAHKAERDGALACLTSSSIASALRAGIRSERGAWFNALGRAAHEEAVKAGAGLRRFDECRELVAGGDEGVEEHFGAGDLVAASTSSELLDQGRGQRQGDAIANALS